MRLEKFKEYFEIFTACWKFFRKYVELIEKVDTMNPPDQGKIDNDSYWEMLVNESAEIYERYGNTEFVKDVLLATTNEIEKIYKEEKR